MGYELIFSYPSLCVVRPVQEDCPFSLESIFEINRADSSNCAARSHTRHILIEDDDGDVPCEINWFGKFKVEGEFQVYGIMSDRPQGVNIDWLVASGGSFFTRARVGIRPNLSVSPLGL